MSERQLRRTRERLEERKRRGGLSRRSRVIVAAGATLSATALAAPAAHADTYTVDSLDDTDEVEGTLREEIEDASSTLEADTIVFESGLSGTITLENGQITIDDPLTIQGPGIDVITVSGDEQYRIFYGDYADSLTISGLTLEDGYVSGGDNGGALYTTNTDVTLSAMAFRNNVAMDDGAGAGAVQVDEGDLTVEASEFTNNYAYESGGALYAAEEGFSTAITNSNFSGNRAETNSAGALYLGETETSITGSTFTDNFAGDEGGALYSYGDVSISGSTFTGNTADALYGGAIQNDGGGDGSLAIDRTTITGNTAGEQGGGVFVDETGNDEQVEVRITNSTIAGNDAGLYGGGVSIQETLTDVVISNSTISGNTADRGGAIRFQTDEDYDPSLTVQNSTIAGNVATEAGGGLYQLGTDDDDDGQGDTITLSSTIVADNAAPSGPDLAGGGDGDPTTFASGFSLVENGTPAGGATTSETTPGTNLFGVDPQLGPLASNGGPTLTQLPAPTSPVLDKGIANGLANDQRGLARTADVASLANATGGDGTDIGAVELATADCRGSAAVKIDGTEGNDALTGTDAADAISALGGADTANAAGGNDCVNGGAGKDKLKGAGGKDQLKGEAGKDNLKGGGGKDRLAGAGGKDKLSGGGGKDRLKGGPGKDKLKGGGGKDRFNCGGGKDKVTAQAKDKVSASCEKVVEKG